MNDDQISEALNAYEADEQLLLGAMTVAGIIASGDAVADVRALAGHFDIEVDQVLYGLFDENSPLYREEKGDV